MDSGRAAPFTDIIAITLAKHAERSVEERLVCPECLYCKDIADNALCHAATTLIGGKLCWYLEQNK